MRATSTTTGICPRCEATERTPGRSYCLDCLRAVNREHKRAERAGQTNMLSIAGIEIGSIQERNERMAAIKARVARRRKMRASLRGAGGTVTVRLGKTYERRQGSLRPDIRYSRCTLPRRPETLAEMRSIHAQPPCGALCFLGEEDYHLAEVHGLTGAVEPWPFTPVEERRDDEEAA